jgi:hypothetical protein
LIRKLQQHLLPGASPFLTCSEDMKSKCPAKPTVPLQLADEKSWDDCGMERRINSVVPTLGILKVQCHEIFDPRFFSSNNTP